MFSIYGIEFKIIHVCKTNLNMAKILYVFYRRDALRNQLQQDILTIFSRTVDLSDINIADFNLGSSATTTTTQTSQSKVNILVHINACFM